MDARPTWKAERDLLGLAILDPIVVDEIGDALTPEDFARPPHGNLWRRLGELRADAMHARAEGETWTQAVMVEAYAWGTDVDGAAYVASLMREAPPDRAAAPYYVKKVREAKAARVLRDAVCAAVERLDAGERAEVVGAGVEAALAALAARGELSAETWVPIGGVAVEVYEERMQASINPASVARRVVASPWSRLNELTRGGFRRREMAILAGRPGTGKTAAAMQCASFASESCAVGVFSMEMTRHGLTTREIARHSGVYLTKLTGTGPVNERDEREMIAACEELGRRPIWIDDTPALHVTQLRARAKRLKAKAEALGLDLGLIVVDYVQLAAATAGKMDNEQVILSRISQAMVALAKELDVAVLALAQMNRAVEGRANERPKNSDLRGTGQLEQDAAVIVFTYRDMDGDDANARELIVTKARHGETGSVVARWDGEVQTLREVDPVPRVQYRPREVDRGEEWR
jgi:replicative DNA helicase